MLKELSRTEAAFHVWAYDDSSDVTASMGLITIERLVEHDDEDAILPELCIVQQGCDVLLQPCIGSGETAAVRVMNDVGRDKGESR